MDFDNCDRPAPEKKLSEHFVEFIDLTDEDLKEIEVLEFARGGNAAILGCKKSYSDTKCKKDCDSGASDYDDYGDYGDDSGY